jgi:hypothetical protein
MIFQAVIIILTILIISNIFIAIYNKINPPCLSSKDYFNNARKLPDGAALNLGSIPTSVQTDYIGVQTVETRIPGVIGIKSRNAELDPGVSQHFSALFPTISTENQKPSTRETSKYGQLGEFEVTEKHNRIFTKNRSQPKGPARFQDEIAGYQAVDDIAG